MASEVLADVFGLIFGKESPLDGAEECIVAFLGINFTAVIGIDRVEDHLGIGLSSLLLSLCWLRRACGIREGLGILLDHDGGSGNGEEGSSEEFHFVCVVVVVFYY